VDLLSIFLKSSNIELLGSTIAGKTPEGAKEIARISHSIFDVISYLNKESDNHSAITVFKLLGAKLNSNPGTIENGQEVIESFLTEIGVNRYSYEILEGSGLSRYNFVTADLYIKLLKYMYDDKFMFEYYLNSLSVAGKDGTLKTRMIGTEAEGNVYAKTGTLNSVSALCGYTIDRDKEILIFYIVMNGFGSKTNSMKDVQDEFCIALSEFSRK
ncbi:MAG: D-alanyl-D-alanine carboxypeptidase/D-alanyl-D-alanine endopeptidase, partial [Ignavibacteria bacterium]